MLEPVGVDLLEVVLDRQPLLLVLVRRVRRPVAARGQHLDHQQPVGGKLGRDDVVDLAGGVARPAHLDAHLLGRDRPHRVAGRRPARRTRRRGRCPRGRTSCRAAGRASAAGRRTASPARPGCGARRPTETASAPPRLTRHTSSSPVASSLRPSTLSDRYESHRQPAPAGVTAGAGALCISSLTGGLLLLAWRWSIPAGRRRVRRPGLRRPPPAPAVSPRSSRQPNAAANASPAPRPFTTSTGWAAIRSLWPPRVCTVAPSGPCFCTSTPGPSSRIRAGSFTPAAAVISWSDPSTMSAMRAHTRTAAA